MCDHVNMAGGGDGSMEQLVEEFNSWVKTQNKAVIYLLEATSNLDGCTLMNFSLRGEQEFMLRCPPSGSDGDRCLAEAGPRLHSWAKAMNKFLLDSPIAPGLGEVLSKAIELYLQEDSSESASMDMASMKSRDCSIPCEGSSEVAAVSNSAVNSPDSLMTEFDEWNKRTKDEMIFLLEASLNADGSICLRFSLGGEYEFVLHCPQSYSSLDDRFLVLAAPRLNSWSTVLNEFLMDTPEMLRLEKVLSKAVELYLKEKICQMNEEDSSCDSDEEMESDVEEESGNEVEMTDEDVFTTEWELKVARKKKRWMQKELELRKQMDLNKKGSSDIRTKCCDLLDGITGPSTQQIFSTNASSGVLINDLIAFMEKGKEIGIVAEPVDDNIYCWCVKMSRFEHSSPLNEDLRLVHQLFGYKHIELQLDFTMNMYPFYPPQLKVIRPRLQGALMQRISNLELLKLSQWNPCCNLISVLLEIKDFVQHFARLETHRERNCPKKFPEGAYLPLDHHLLRLAMVSEVSPRANSQFVLPLEKSAVCNSQVKSMPFTNDGKKNPKQEYWASGTGFGHSNRPGWDIAAFMAAQNLKDRQIEVILSTIVEDLQNDSRCFAGHDCSTQTPAVPQMVTEQVERISGGDCIDETPEDLYEVIEGSALIPFLETHLKVDSLLEVGRHVVLYNAIVDVVREIARQPDLIRLLGPLPRQTLSIHCLLESLKKQMSCVLERIDKVNVAAESNIQSNLQEIDLAREFCNVYEEVKKVLEDQGILNGVCDPEPPDPDGENRNTDGNLEEVIYCKCLKPLQLKSFHFESGPDGKVPHAFAAILNKSNPPSPKQVMRIAQELSALSDSLPLTLSSSIFVRMDDDKCCLLRALITGPEGTPYSGGCFQFDVYFPSRYPQEPPKVQLMTTGKGTVRFNPNLYACGKVCLSLLGTWEGQKGEKWNETSTLLQVLISIQSLILVPEPYFNEPGYEVSIGTDAGQKRSQAYNQDVLTNSIKWAMVDQLKNPTPGFEDVIRTHFSLRKASLQKEIDGWVGAYGSKNLTAAISQLQEQLKLLPDVQEPT